MTATARFWGLWRLVGFIGSIGFRVSGFGFGVSGLADRAQERNPNP